MYKAIMFYLLYFLLTHLIFYLIFLKKMLPKNSFVHWIHFNTQHDDYYQMISSVPLQIFS